MRFSFQGSFAWHCATSLVAWWWIDFIPLALVVSCGGANWLVVWRWFALTFHLGLGFVATSLTLWLQSGLAFFCTVLGPRALLLKELGDSRALALLAGVSPFFLVASPTCSRRAPTTSLLRSTARWWRKRREPAHGSRFQRGPEIPRNGDPSRRR